MEYLSKERHDQLVEELNQLISVEYPRIKDELSEARAQGDLSENYEYRAARRAQDYKPYSLPAEGPSVFEGH